MKNRDEIRRADRKALPKMLLLVLAGAVIGFLVGLAGIFVLAEAGPEGLSRVWTQAQDGLALAAPWLLGLCIACQLALGLAGCGRAGKLIDGWDGEDETVPDRAERLLDRTTCLSAMVNVLAFFLFSSSMVGSWEVGRETMAGVALFAVHMCVAVPVQTRVVNLIKRLYPEKTASALDPRFQKKWLADCDEAERAMIGECAYHAYQAASRWCLALWCIFTITALLFGTGILPVLAVCLIWGVSQGVYCRWAMKLEHLPVE